LSPKERTLGLEEDSRRKSGDKKVNNFKGKKKSSERPCSQTKKEKKKDYLT